MVSTFQGFVQFQIPTDVTPPSGVGTWYRLKERQTIAHLAMTFPRAPHYSDDGTLAVDPSGQTIILSNVTIKLTSDMFDDVTWTYTNW